MCYLDSRGGEEDDLRESAGLPGGCQHPLGSGALVGNGSNAAEGSATCFGGSPSQPSAWHEHPAPVQLLVGISAAPRSRAFSAQTGARHFLGDTIKGKDMVPQALSNCFCAAAKLQDAAEEVLKVLPAIVAEIPKKAGDMIPQALTNCLWAAAQLQEVDAGVLRVVPGAG